MTVFELKSLVDELVSKGQGSFEVNILLDNSTLCPDEGHAEGKTYKGIHSQKGLNPIMSECEEVPCESCGQPHLVAMPKLDEDNQVMYEDSYIILHFSK